MNALRAQLMYALSHAGWVGALGAALCAFALAVHLGAAAPLQAELDTLHNEQMVLAERLSQGVTVESPREQVERFDATLVPRARVPALLAELAHAAGRNGLALARVESRESQSPGAGYGRQEYLFPLRGGYPQLRAWLADIRRVSPAVVIEDVVLRREDIARSGMDASVRLSILLRESP